MRIDLPYRKCIRLPAEAYNEQGLYFLTICTKDREEELGKISVGDADPYDENVGVDLAKRGALEFREKIDKK